MNLPRTIPWALLGVLGLTPLAHVSAQAAEQPSLAAAPAAASDVVDLSAGLTAVDGGLTSSEIVKQALQTSPALTRSTIERDKADVNKARAELAFFPRVDLSARYTRLSPITLPDIMGAPNPFKPVLDQYAATAGLRLPITDLFLTILPTYRGANTMRDVAESQRKAKEASVAYDARAAFFDYLRARGANVVADDSVRVREANVKDIQALVGAGAARQSDLLSSQAALGEAQLFQMQMRGLLELAVLRLSRLTGTEFDMQRPLGETLVGGELGPTPDATALLRESLQVRHELLALRSLLRAREQFANARRGAEMPQISATGNVYYANPNPRIFPQRPEFDTTWDVGIGVSWSPNDFMMARSQAEDADTDLSLVRQDLRALEDAIALEVSMAVNSHREAREEVATKNEGVVAAQRYFDDQRALLKAGAATPKDVLDAEAALRRAQLEVVDAYLHARLAEAALLKARGDTGLAQAATPSSTGSSP